MRGRGLLLALELKGTTRRKVARSAMDRGLLLNAPRPDTLRFMPALNVTRNEIERDARAAGVGAATRATHGGPGGRGGRGPGGRVTRSCTGEMQMGARIGELLTGLKRESGPW